jgi:hypothetical protein
MAGSQSKPTGAEASPGHINSSEDESGYPPLRARLTCSFARLTTVDSAGCVT